MAGVVAKLGPRASEELPVRVRVDAARCQGHTLCARTAPDAFESSEIDGHASARFDVVPSELEAEVRVAADLCPERAIVVSD